MSRELDLKRLKKSLHETQDILNDLITETSSELEKKWDVSQKDAGKRLAEAGKRFEKTYDQARNRLDSTLKGTTKDLEKRYSTSKKEAEKVYDKTRHSANQNFKDLSAEANKRLSEVKKTANKRTQDLRLRTADLLQGLAAGVLAFRNKLNPKTRYAIRDEKQKHHLGKGGYFKRFIALAIIIVSKKDQLLSLGSQLYNKLQDQESRDALKDDALGQFDTMRRLIKAYANGEYREFPYMSIVKIVAAVVYFVSVVDLIPDFIPIIGLTDDLAVLAWVFMSVKDDLQNFVDWEAANERRQEKMENQKENAGTSAGTSKTSSSLPVADREASPNTGASRTSTTPSATAAVGASSSVINNRAAEASRQNNDTNTGSAGNTAGSTGGSASKSAGTSGSSASGNNTNSGSTSGGGGNSGGSSSANQGNTNQKSGGSSPSSGGNSGR